MNHNTETDTHTKNNSHKRQKSKSVLATTTIIIGIIILVFVFIKYTGLINSFNELNNTKVQIDDTRHKSDLQATSQLQDIVKLDNIKHNNNQLKQNEQSKELLYRINLIIIRFLEEKEYSNHIKYVKNHTNINKIINQTQDPKNHNPQEHADIKKLIKILDNLEVYNEKYIINNTQAQYQDLTPKIFGIKLNTLKITKNMNFASNISKKQISREIKQNLEWLIYFIYSQNFIQTLELKELYND